MATPDLAGFSGQRTHTILDGGFTRADYINALHENLLDSGWQVLAGPTAQTFGNSYTYLSQQSPWYDTDNIPDWYVGNRIALETDHTNSVDFRFRYGAYRNDTGVIELMSSASEFHRLRIGETLGARHHLLACPYQFATWSERDNVASNNTHAGFFVSALNLPKFFLQRNAIIHLIYASDGFRTTTQSLGGNFTNTYVAFKTNGSLGAYRFNQHISTFVTPIGALNNRSGRRIWYRELDPEMADDSKWSMFYVPPRLIFRLPGTSNLTINGFLWDAILMSQAFTRNAVISAGGFNWMKFAGFESTNPNVQGANLFFRIA